jgi:hypothetical protein
MSGFHRKNDLLRLAVPFVFIVEVKTTVDALVRAFLLLQGTRAYQAERLPLELVRIVLGECNRQPALSLSKGRKPWVRVGNPAINQRLIPLDPALAQNKSLGVSNRGDPQRASSHH